MISDVVLVFGLLIHFGGDKSTGFASIYDTLDFAKKFKSKHKLTRHSLYETQKLAWKLRNEHIKKLKKVRGTMKSKVGAVSK